jgi:hypothetical protein
VGKAIVLATDLGDSEEVSQLNRLRHQIESGTWDEVRDPQRWREEMDKVAESVRTRNRRKAELQKRHWETWSAVKRAVDGADPYGLLALGCPNDEYDDAVVYLTDTVVEHEPLSPESLSAWFRARYGSTLDADAIRLIVDSLAAIR